MSARSPLRAFAALALLLVACRFRGEASATTAPSQFSVVRLCPAAVTPQTTYEADSGAGIACDTPGGQCTTDPGARGGASVTCNCTCNGYWTCSGPAITCDLGMPQMPDGGPDAGVEAGVDASVDASGGDAG
jgi:hypothetical protein